MFEAVTIAAVLTAEARVLGSSDAVAAELNAAATKVSGVVIDHSPARARQYIGSPSLAIWTNGSYVVSHDFFGPGSTRDQTARLSIRGLAI